MALKLNLETRLPDFSIFSLLLLQLNYLSF